MKTFAAVLLLLGAAVCWGTGGAAAAAQPVWGDMAAPAVLLAQATASLPDPQSNQAIVWVGVAIVGLIVLCGAVAGAIASVIFLIDRIRGKREVTVQGKMQTHPSPEGPSRVEFDLHVDGLRDDVTEIKSSLKEINANLGSFSSAQYSARARMHQRLNRIETAMFFWAGKLAGAGDPDAAELRRILNQSEEGGNE